MPAPPYRILTSPEFARILRRIKSDDQRKYKKVLKAIRLLRDVGPKHPGLNSHKYHSLAGPNGEEMWEAYVENQTPGAWRLWWHYGPEADTISLISVGPHP